MDERTQEILRRFETSWEQTQYHLEEIQTGGWSEQIEEILQFTTELKSQGAHRDFRLGFTLLGFVILSRSVEPRLRDDQKFIKIEPNLHSYRVVLKDAFETYREYTVTSLNDERVMKLLETLKHTLID